MLEKIMRIQPLKNNSQPNNSWKHPKRRESEGNPSFKEILDSLMGGNFEENNITVSSNKATTEAQSVYLSGYHVDLMV